MGWPDQSSVASLRFLVCGPRYAADPTPHRCCEFDRGRWLSALWNVDEISNTEMNTTESPSLPGSGFSGPLHDSGLSATARIRTAQDKQAMNAQIVRRLSPEEEELARKREELVLLQAELAERELFMTNLRAELAAFEGRYLRQVGTLYAELDEWNAKIAERLADEKGTEESRSAAARAREQAYESDSAVHGVAAKAQDFLPSAEMKALYREVARRVHPDLATDEADRQKREHLMAEANAAFQRGDADALRRILEEYESSPESVRGAGIAADLVRAIRQITQVRRRLTLIELEIERLSDSEIARLRIKADAARAEGRELLAEMAEDVRRRINVARRRFEAGSVAKTKA